jgi:hypothetical protein
VNKADKWLGSLAPNPQRGNSEVRGLDTARTINARPFQIIILRGDPPVALTPQIVRIEILQSARQALELHDPMLAISRQYVIVMGYKECPGIPDTDLKRADRFFYDNLEWEIVEFLPTIPGRLLASAMATP